MPAGASALVLGGSLVGRVGSVEVAIGRSIFGGCGSEWNGMGWDGMVGVGFEG